MTIVHFVALFTEEPCERKLNNFIKMFFATVIAALLVADEVKSSGYDQCNGNKQSIVVPKGYDKDVPDAFETGNATGVHVKYGIKHLREVKEER